LAAAAEQVRRVDRHAATADLSTNHVVLLQTVVRALQVQEIAVPAVVAAAQVAATARIVIVSRAVVVVMLAAETVVATTTDPASNRRRLQ
jgi:hypothetical protein